MAICPLCKGEMNNVDGCVPMSIRTVEGLFKQVKYGEETRNEPPHPGQLQHGVVVGDPPRCHDCRALPGHVHHLNCDWEECPRCHEQLIGCDCVVEEIEASEEVVL
jgi:hypothetical protein